MNPNKYFYLLSIIITLQVAIVATTETAPKRLQPSKEIIVSPDSQDEKSNSKDQVDEIRKSIKKEEKVPVASVQQIHETSNMREKIVKAVKEDKYEKGEDVPDNIDVQLNARKDDVQVKVAATEDGITADVSSMVEASDSANVNENLSDPIDERSKEAIEDVEDNAPGTGYTGSTIIEEINSHGQRNKIFLRTPSFTKVTIPILAKLRKKFWENLFA